MPSSVIAIDPGPAKSAAVVYNGKITFYVECSNEALRKWLKEVFHSDRLLAIEWIEGYGLTVGESVFHTCRWIGRYQELWNGETLLIGRKKVKSALCGNVTAKDKFVREALIDRLGPPGTKKNPGPTYGITKDLWSALAVAVVVWDEVEW